MAEAPMWLQLATIIIGLLSVSGAGMRIARHIDNAHRPNNRTRPTFPRRTRQKRTRSGHLHKRTS